MVKTNQLEKDCSNKYSKGENLEKDNCDVLYSKDILIEYAKTPSWNQHNNFNNWMKWVAR